LATLKELRDACYLTQAQVAERLGLSVSTVSNWERGEYPPRRRLFPELAKLYGVTPQEIEAASPKGKKKDDS
jgi:transcriptional regulator with XRE-family HTH domain